MVNDGAGELRQLKGLGRVCGDLPPALVQEESSQGHAAETDPRAAHLLDPFLAREIEECPRIELGLLLLPVRWFCMPFEESRQDADCPVVVHGTGRALPLPLFDLRPAVRAEAHQVLHPELSQQPGRDLPAGDSAQEIPRDVEIGHGSPLRRRPTTE